MKWRKSALPKIEYHQFQSTFALDPITTAICMRRGLTSADELRFFLRQELYLLHNPFLINHIERGAQRILTAQRRGEAVLVFGDRDVDGMASTALMVELLTNMGIKTHWRVPMRNEPYGLTQQVMKEILAKKIDLIITIDCGIHNRAEIAEAQRHAVDTIVIDHHNVTDALPPAYAIINPKIAGSRYPTSEICGTMLGYKLALVMGIMQSSLYNSPHLLAVARRAPQSLAIDIYKICNLSVVERYNKILIDNDTLSSKAQSSFKQLLHSYPLYVYNADSFLKLLRPGYTQVIPSTLHDLQPALATLDSQLAARSLYEINRERLLVPSVHADSQEIETLHLLYNYWHLFGNSMQEPQYGSYLELATLATVADMMPMRNENRVLVKEGLRRLARAPSIRFQHLLRESKVPVNSINSRYLSFNIIPCFNAAGRRGVPDRAIKLLLAKDQKHAQELSAELIQLNHERRNICHQAMQIALPLAYKSLERYQRRLVVVVHSEIERGVTGLLASQLMEQLHATTVVISHTTENTSGSLRTVAAQRATEILQHCASLLIEWGGHDRAAGFQIAPVKLAPFEQQLANYMQQLPAASSVPLLEIDAELPTHYFNEHIFEIAQWFEPYGQQNQPPLFLTRGLEVQECWLFGKEDQHLKLLLQAGEYRVPAILWNGADHTHSPLRRGSYIDAIYRVEISYWLHQEQRRLVISDMQPSSSSSALPPKRAAIPLR